MDFKKTPARMAAVKNTAVKNTKVDKERRKDFGQRMKRIRLEREMTQMDMAVATGQVYFTFISQIETGMAKIPTKDIGVWAKALGLDVSEFAKAYLKATDEHLFNAIFAAGDRKTIL